MTTSSTDRSWSLPVLRAIPAAAVALVITFSADHSALLGLLALGTFAVATGVIIGAGALRAVTPRNPFLAQGVLLVVGGIAAFALAQSQLPTLMVLTIVLFAATGVMELVAGLRARGRAAAARDWVFVGALSLVLSLGVVLVPADLVDVISIPGKEVPPLTASIVIVGLLGAYAAIVAVYLVIAGLSLKWAPQASAVALEN